MPRAAGPPHGGPIAWRPRRPVFFIYQQKRERAGPFRHPPPHSQLPGSGTRRELSVAVRSFGLIRANLTGPRRQVRRTGADRIRALNIEIQSVSHTADD